MEWEKRMCVEWIEVQGHGMSVPQIAHFPEDNGQAVSG